MRYQEIKPNAAAARFVRCYWMLEDDAPGSGIQRIVPDGRAELILNLGQPYESQQEGTWKPQPQCFFFGQITGPLVLRPGALGAPARMIGIRFHPHTAGRLLQIPMCELTDAAVPLDEISGRLYRELQDLEGHCSDGSPLGRFAALDRIVGALGKRVSDDDHVLGAAVRELESAVGSMSVGALAEQAGLSARQFERRFRQAVGIPPKLFSRMQRFQRVFPALESADGGWVDAAMRCGYYDQAHLIRDFREFAGKPPAALLAEDSDLARHFVEGARMSHFSKTRADRSR
jgi:AraC-like DNA-binding protein